MCQHRSGRGDYSGQLDKLSACRDVCAVCVERRQTRPPCRPAQHHPFMTKSQCRSSGCSGWAGGGGHKRAGVTASCGCAGVFGRIVRDGLRCLQRQDMEGQQSAARSIGEESSGRESERDRERERERERESRRGRAEQVYRRRGDKPMASEDHGQGIKRRQREPALSARTLLEAPWEAPGGC